MESVYPFERMHVISQQAHNVEIWLNIGLVLQRKPYFSVWQMRLTHQKLSQMHVCL